MISFQNLTPFCQTVTAVLHNQFKTLARAKLTSFDFQPTRPEVKTSVSVHSFYFTNYYYLSVVIIRKATISDREDIAELYRNVAGNVIGISRRPHEITDTYVYSLLNKKPSDIVCLVAMDDDCNIVGVIHGTKNGLEVYSHILGDLTVIVKPEHQSKGIATKLSMEFLEHIFKERPDIMRIEMEVITILKLIQAFEFAGFVKEAETTNRIKNADGTFSNSVLMAWFNPNFKP